MGAQRERLNEDLFEHVVPAEIVPRHILKRSRHPSALSQNQTFHYHDEGGKKHTSGVWLTKKSPAETEESN